MKALLTAIGISVVVLGLSAAGIFTTMKQQSHITLQAQQLHILQSRVSRLQAQLSTDQVRLAGNHRDLITCGDINALLNGWTSANAGNYVGLNQVITNAIGAGYSDPLPSHCLNQ